MTKKKEQENGDFKQQVYCLQGQSAKEKESFPYKAGSRVSEGSNLILKQSI